MKKILKKLISFIFRDRLIHDTENKKTNKQKTEIEDNFFNGSPLSSKRISFLGKLFMKNSKEMAFFSLTCEPKWVMLLHP